MQALLDLKEYLILLDLVSMSDIKLGVIAYNPFEDKHKRSELNPVPDW